MSRARVSPLAPRQAEGDQNTWRIIASLCARIAGHEKTVAVPVADCHAPSPSIHPIAALGGIGITPRRRRYAIGVNGGIRRARAAAKDPDQPAGTVARPASWPHEAGPRPGSRRARDFGASTETLKPASGRAEGTGNTVRPGS